MRRRADGNGRYVPFPEHLLDGPLRTDDDAEVAAALDASGWTVVDYLIARHRRRRILQGWTPAPGGNLRHPARGDGP